MIALLRRPSAFLPLAVSALLLALIAIHLVRFGTLQQADEGTEAHLFQILMPVQLAIIAFFAMTWLQKNPTAAVRILALQISAALLVLAAVYFGHG